MRKPHGMHHAHGKVWIKDWHFSYGWSLGSFRDFVANSKKCRVTSGVGRSFEVEDASRPCRATANHEEKAVAGKEELAAPVAHIEKSHEAADDGVSTLARIAIAQSRTSRSSQNGVRHGAYSKTARNVALSWIPRKVNEQVMNGQSRLWTLSDALTVLISAVLVIIALAATWRASNRDLTMKRIADPVHTEVGGSATGVTVCVTHCSGSARRPFGGLPTAELTSAAACGMSARASHDSRGTRLAIEKVLTVLVRTMPDRPAIIHNAALEGLQ